MRRAHLVVLLVLLGVLLPAAPAAAAGFIEWLERLSGPGPFWGGGYEMTFICYGVKVDGPGVEAEATDAEAWFISLECRRAARNARRIAVGARAAWLTGKNNLEYDQPLPEGARNVRVFRFDAIGDYSINRTFDIGAGLGVMRLTGMPADALTRFVIQPVRLTWKPLTMRKGLTAKESYDAEWFQIRYAATLVPGGFEDADFGARPGTRLEGGTEFLSTLTFAFRF